MGLLEFLAGADPGALLLTGAVIGGLVTTLVLLALLPLEVDGPGRARGRCAGCGEDGVLDGDRHDAAGP